jgi:hypothetical protein
MGPCKTQQNVNANANTFEFMTTDFSLAEEVAFVA